MNGQEKSRMDAKVVAEALAKRAGLEESREAEAEKLYQKFCESKQEAVRLAVALRGYFMEKGPLPGQKVAYEAYLKGRIRPAMELLIEMEAVEKMEVLEEKGFLSEIQLEGYIKTARECGKMAALVWLLHLKHEKYSFCEKDFSL